MGALSGLEPFGFGVEIGSGVALGVIGGYATKKLVKIALVFLGLAVMALKFLEARGYVAVNWGKIANETANNSSATSDAAASSATGLVNSLIGTLPFGSGFAIGFAVGMKKG